MITYAWNPTTNQVEETTVTTVVTPLDPTSVQNQIDAVNAQIANYQQQLADYTVEINGLVVDAQTQLTALQSQLDNLKQIIAENTPTVDTTQPNPLPDNN